MNWMRRNVQPRLRAIALASMVLPVPGTSSMSRCPRHMSATSASRTSWCLPTMTRSTLAMTLSPTCWMLLIGLPSVVRPRRGLREPGVCRCPDRPYGDGGQRELGRERRRASTRSVRPHRAQGSRTCPAVTLNDARNAAAIQPRNNVMPPTQMTIRQPMAPMTPRNGSPPMNDATRHEREHRGERQGDDGQAEPLDHGPRPGARARAVGGVGGGRRSRAGMLRGLRTARSSGPSTTRERRRPLAAPAALLDEHGDRDLRVLDRREPDEPRVRLAGAAELGRARLAGGRHARHRRPRRELAPEIALDRLAASRPGSPPRRSPPSPGATSTGPRSRAPDPSPVSARHQVRPHEHAVVGDGRRHERHLERRHERLALPERRGRELDVVREPARRAAVAAGDPADRRRQVERDRGPEAELRRLVDEVVAARRQPGQRVPDVAADLGRADEVERRVAGLRVVAVLDPEPLDEEAALLGLGLLRERRVGGRPRRCPGPRSAVTILNTDPGT